MCQFSDQDGRDTLADFIKEKGFYAAGRLDYDSEGLLLLTNDGALNHRITHPSQKLPKTYVVQVEGQITEDAIQSLEKGVQLKDGLTKPSKAVKIPEPEFWPRNPPVRFRAEIPTSWLQITITEGKNRQVRRMTAQVGYPTLRLIRTAIGPWKLGDLKPGESLRSKVNLPATNNKSIGRNSKKPTPKKPQGRRLLNKKRK